MEKAASATIFLVSLAATVAVLASVASADLRPIEDWTTTRETYTNPWERIVVLPGPRSTVRQSTIEMTDAKVRVEVGPLPSVRHLKLNVRVTGTFLMTNTSDTPQDILVDFPLAAPPDTADATYFRVRNMPEFGVVQRPPSWVQHFAPETAEEISVDYLVALPLQKSEDYLPVLKRSGWRPRYRLPRQFDHPLPPPVTHSPPPAPPPSGALAALAQLLPKDDSFYFFSYSLRSGAFWRGPLGLERIIFEFDKSWIGRSIYLLSMAPPDEAESDFKGARIVEFVLDVDGKAQILSRDWPEYACANFAPIDGLPAVQVRQCDPEQDVYLILERSEPEEE